MPGRREKQKKKKDLLEFLSLCICIREITDKAIKVIGEQLMLTIYFLRAVPVKYVHFLHTHNC